MRNALALAALVAAASRAGASQPLPAVGASVERTLGPGETLSLEASLERGEFLRVVVEQRGIDVVLSAFAPDGRRLVRVDRAGGQFGLEPISIVARRGGIYAVRIEPLPGSVVPGRVVVSVAERRPAGARDAVRVAAEKELERSEWPADRESGLRACRRGLDLFAELGDDFERTGLLFRLGDLEAERGRSQGAADAYRRALDLAAGLKNARLQAVALRAIGTQLTFSGESRRAADVLAESVRLARASGHPQIEAGSLQLLGWSLWGRCEYEKALEAGERAAALARQCGDRATEGWAVHVVGITYATLGDLPRGLDSCRQAAELCRAGRDGRGEALALSDAGWILYRGGRLQSAEQTLRRVVDLQRAMANRGGEALGLVSLAHVTAALGRRAEATATYRQALALARVAHAPLFEAHALSGLGRLAAVSSDPAAARAFFEEERALRHRLEDPAAETQAALELARLDRAEGRLLEAHRRIETAIATIEGMNVGFLSPYVRTFASASSQPLYDFAVDVLMTLNDSLPAGGFDRLAFEMAERGRARVLREDLAGAAVEAGRVRPLTLPEVQASLPPGTALVSFDSGDERLVVFLVTGAAFLARRLPVDQTALTARLENAVDLLSTGDGSGARSLARRLGADLVAPWRAALPPGISRLVIVPDGVLARLPFEVLPGGRDTPRRLIEDFEISYAPSASILSRLRAKRGFPDSRKDLLVVAGPGAGKERVSALYEDEGFTLGPLPFALAEARRVARFGGEGSLVLTGPEATVARVSSLAKDGYRVLHFATHGLVSQRSPWSSALALAADPGDPAGGLLTARALHRLKIPSDLVVLSACQTARGRVFAGEGVQSLARAFLEAGTRSVVASLWKVNDEGAADFMEAFYRGLSRGASKAAALRGAKLASLARGEPPAVWAPFVLLGEPDGTVPLAGGTLFSRIASWLSR